MLRKLESFLMRIIRLIPPWRWEEVDDDVLALHVLYPLLDSFDFVVAEPEFQLRMLEKLHLDAFTLQQMSNDDVVAS